MKEYSHNSSAVYGTSEAYRENYKRLEEERKKKQEEAETKEKEAYDE